MLIIKQGFQFLYSFHSGLGQKVMRLFQHSCQVFRAIVTSNTIKVVNHPTFRKWLAVIFFPNKYMFTDIATFVSPRMCRLTNINIAMFISNFSAFPLTMLFGRSVLHYFNETGLAHLSSFMHRLTAFGTGLRIFATKMSIRVRKAITLITFPSFGSSVISGQSLKSVFLCAIRAIRLLAVHPTESLSTVLTFNGNHHTYKFSTTANESQFLCREMIRGSV